MNTQHTPGPWVLSGGNYAIVTKDGQLVPVINLPNALLIAAAPELLDALIDAENLLKQLSHERFLDNDTWDAIDKTIDKARNALAKAEA